MVSIFQEDTESIFGIVLRQDLSVGSLSNGPNSLGDKDHEGHSGWRIDEIASSINGWLNAAAGHYYIDDRHE